VAAQIYIHGTNCPDSSPSVKLQLTRSVQKKVFRIRSISIYKNFS